MSSIYDWSLFAASNANADDIINWAEGQPPSSVNNSARSMMQRIREFIADLGGGITGGGTGNSIVLSSMSPVTAYTSGIVIRFRALHSNTDKATMNLNNLGPKPIFKPGPEGAVPLAGREIQAGCIYEAVYDQALNNGGGGWFLMVPTQPQAIPAGMIAPFAMPKTPEGWLLCDGAQISRQTYSSLFTAIGTWWGAGDGTTTFHLPDLRGMFLRGWDQGRNQDPKRVFASGQESENKSHKHGAYCSVSGGHSHNYVYSRPEGWRASGDPLFQRIGEQYERATSHAGDHQHIIEIAVTGGQESRPVNHAVLYAIKI